MKKKWNPLANLAASMLVVFAATAAANPVVLIETNQGKFAVELYQDKAPKTVNNFLNYVKEGYYNETIFHRVIQDPKMSIVQGGGYLKYERDEIQEKPGLHDPIELELNPELHNSKYTIAMARLNHPNTATAQFFINAEDNSKPFDGNYAVFGRILKGCTGCEKVIDKINATNIKPFKHEEFGKPPVIANDVPANPIKIISAVVLKE